MTRPILRTRLLLGLLLLMIWIALSPIVLGTSTRGLAAPLPHVTALPTAPLPASFPIVVKVIKSANVRSGPGTEYPVISGARPGQRLNVVDCNLDCSWYKLADDCWIAAFLVQPEISVGVSQPFPTVIVSTVITSPLPPSVDSTPAVGIELPQQSVPQPSLQPTQCPQTMRTVNTHAGPGTFYPVVDTRPAGECIAVIGRNSVGDWFQMSHGMWIAASAILYAEPIETMPITDALFTATPEPTPTPILADVPVIDISTDELIFVTEVQSIFSNYSVILNLLSEQLNAGGDSPMLIFSEDWRIKTATAIALIYDYNSRLRSLVPPVRFANAWAQVLTASDMYDRAMDALVSGLDNFDIAQIELASQYMREAQDAVNRAAALLPQ